MNKGQGGFTLIEVLVSVVLLVIVVLSFTSIFSQGFAGLGKSREKMDEFYRAESSLINTIMSGSTDENTTISIEDENISFEKPDGTVEEITIEDISKVISSVQYNNGHSTINLYGYIPGN